MSEKSKGAGTGLSLAGTIGTLTAFFTNSTLKGLAGFGKAMMIGGATSFGSGIVALGGVLAGGLVGLAVSGGRKEGGIIGAVVGAIVGAIYGGVQGYEFGEKAIIDPCNQTTSLNIQ